ncbi:hypothetical protein H310_11625 [Aphanomyces invadans]|uniref:Uncharacterized protein n=1 Tax=Aphanomyces invadans TaxID=157072 RepID=A0A024TLG7_9STRA|nr:hypothetical protein H310_11625 [Aphanomyces invadans]ETV94985.1 hypothetical protein H310_11625 [Aphanomyces invadans]|eukprot:XP_008876576.1 hypothetical protein H310_11625 [Aphanomyces invadans]
MKAYDDANRLESGYRSIQDLVKEVRTTRDFVQLATTMSLILNYTHISGGYKYLTCDKVADPDECILEEEQ